MKEFQGYVRANGSVGIRNHTLILSATRAAHVLAAHVGKVVAGRNVSSPVMRMDEAGRIARRSPESWWAWDSIPM